jgi:hypothetical protein
MVAGEAAWAVAPREVSIESRTSGRTEGAIRVDQLTKALVAGVAFAIVAGVTMIPIDFGGRDKKRDAIIAAVVERFAIGFVVVLLPLSMPHFLKGMAVGFVMSLPSAIITRSYAPILAMGTAGGLVIGFLA